MNLSGTTGVGGERDNGARSAPSGALPPVSDPAATTVAALGTTSGARTASMADAMRNAMRSATSSLRAAFSSFNSRSKAVFTTSGQYSGSQARISGIAARVAAVDDSLAVLRATVPVNTQTSTERASSSPIGIDLGMAPSTLSSSRIILDVTSADAPSVLSSAAPLGLDVSVAQAPSTIVSTGGLGAAPSTFASTVLTFCKDGATSTSTGTLSGKYAGTGGAAKATTLTIEILGTATLNAILPVPLHFRVRDQNGATLFGFDGKLRPNDDVYLGDEIGLTLSFSLGTLVDAHIAMTAVGNKRVVPDRNAAFNAPLAQRPQFDQGAIVGAGSFRVNGVTITVNANDTVNTVLSRITASPAGVSASFADERVTLTTTAHSADDIVLAADTSGFLGATKLSAASTTRGSVRDDQRALIKTAQFASVTSGALSVNGISITVNKEADSLATILARITASSAGVMAYFDEASNKAVLIGRSNSKDLIVVSGDNSGFLTAAKLATVNTVRGHVSEDQVPFANLPALESVMAGSFALDGKTIGVSPSDTVQSIVSKINASGARVSAAFAAPTQTITLTTTYFADEEIAIGNDSSGFLAAVGLDSARTVRGKVAKEGQVLSATAAFGAVTRGSFDVNGVSIEVDPSRDTLDDVLARINAPGVGVWATYRHADDTLLFAPAAEGGTLVLDGDTCGFLDAAHLAAGAAGTRFNPNGPFNGRGLNVPLFDPGLSVQSGSFSVNGVTIDVAASDTASHVLERITMSDAGVTASYDRVTQKVSLIRQEGTTPIALGADTSGFLDAVKLDDTAVAGTEVRTHSAFATSLAAMREYTSVQPGVLTVNGHPIDIDPVTITINGVIDAIDALREVAATIDERTGAITIVSRQAGLPIVVSDTSGLLATVGIGLGSYSGGTGGTLSPGVSASDGVAAGAALSPAEAMAQESVRQKLAVEQAQGSLFFIPKMRPRAPEAAALIRSMPVEERRRPSARVAAAPAPSEPKPSTPDSEAMPPVSLGSLSSTPELLKPLVDLFADGAVRRDRVQRAVPAAWWRW